MFLVTKNPLAIGVSLILHTFSLRFFLGSIINYFWFYYILILVFIGGILILFIYATSIFPNEKFFLNQNLLLNSIILITIFFLLTFIILKFFNINLILNNLEINLNIIPRLKTIFSIKIFSSYTRIIYLFLVNYLFYCIVIVIKITNFFRGPLRKMY